jgi:hypothetical protein
LTRVVAALQRLLRHITKDAALVSCVDFRGVVVKITDAIVVAENCVNPWTKFIRKQRGAGSRYGDRPNAAD